MNSTETKTAYTPGPWISGADKRGGFGVWATPAYYNVLDSSAPGINAEANARLIAAAPDLLEALRWSETILHQYWTATTTEEKNHYAADIPSALETMHKAISKAEGRAS